MPTREPQASITIPARVITFLEGTQVAADLGFARTRQDVKSTAVSVSEPIADVILALRSVKSRKDGSTTIRLDREQLEAVSEYSDYLAGAASDNAGPHDFDALADMNAGRAGVRRAQDAIFFLDNR